MPDASRRSVAKGAAWSVPAVTIAAAAPAIAASPCAGIVKGQALPASAFVPSYFVVSNQTFGGAANKSISIVAGIALTPTAATCVGSAALSFTYNTATTGTLALTNGKTYAVTGGTGAAGTGTAGTINGGCTRDGNVTAQACNTYTGLGVTNSTGTSSANPASGTFTYAINVTGYGSTPVTFRVVSFTQSGTNWNGAGLTIS